MERLLFISKFVVFAYWPFKGYILIVANLEFFLNLIFFWGGGYLLFWGLTLRLLSLVLCSGC